MQAKSGPYILLVLLLLLLFFILGVRYGQRVERANKQISKLLSPTPTQKPEKPLQFKTFSHKDCGLEFLYPSTLSVGKETSDSATLEKDLELISFSCAKTDPFSFEDEDQKVATEEVSFQGKKISSQTKTATGQKIYHLTLANPQTGRNIFVLISENLLPLLDASLKLQ